MREAEFLAALRRLPLHAGAAGLADDTARLAGLTISTDTMVEGVHFLPGDPPSDVAWKLIAVNLSDLAAKGTMPEGILLSYPLSRPTPAKAGVQSGDVPAGPRPSSTHQSNTLMGALPPGWGQDWDESFIAGLAEALATFDCPLLGGDTVSLPPGAARVLTLTAFGRDGVAVPRSGAKAGDDLWVTGTIGDAGAGLRIAHGEHGPPELLASYRRPQPRLVEGRALASHVHAMMDVSDGLLLDAARMAEASGLAVAIDLALIPLSPAYRAFAGEDRAARIAAATAGDDYQLLFAAPEGWTPPVPATRIGAFAPGSDLSLTDGGAPIPLPPSLGFQH